jgi:hypothetical protein
LPIERTQLARLRVDLVRARLFALTVGRVEELLPLVERKKRRIGDSFQELKLRPVARGRINLVRADPLTVAIALLRGVAADVCERGVPPGYGVERRPTLAPCQVLVKCPPCETFAWWQNNLPIAQSAETPNPGPKASFPAMAQSMLVFYSLGVVQQKEGAHAP